MDADAALQVIERVVRAVPPEQRRSYREFSRAVQTGLEAEGWTVRREQPAPEHSWPRLLYDRTGRINLVVMHPVRVGIELDNFTPREKSLRKLREFNGVKVVVLRQGRGGRYRKKDVTVIECGQPRAAGGVAHGSHR